MTAVAMVFNQHGKQITSLRLSEKMNVLENSAMNCFRLFSDSTGMEELTDVNFLRLALKIHKAKPFLQMIIGLESRKEIVGR